MKFFPLFSWLEEIGLRMHSFSRSTIGTMMDLETESDDGRNLLTVRGDLVTIMRLQGMGYLPTEKQIEESAESLGIVLRPFFSDKGRVMQFVFLSDPSMTPFAISEHLKTVRSYAQAVNLNVEPLLAEREALWSNRMCLEETYVALRTQRMALTSAEKATVYNEKKARARKSTYRAVDSQKTGLDSDILAAKHEAYVTSFSEAMRGVGVRVGRLGPHEALQVMRTAFDPSTVGSAWRPRLLSDPPTIRHPDDDPKGDISHFLNPPLADQMFRVSVQHQGFNQVDIGPNRFASVDMTLSPEVVLPFSKLFEGLRRPAIPCRISFMMDGGSWLQLGIGPRITLATLMAIFSPINKRILAALKLVEATRQKGGTFIRFRCSAATWAPSSSQDLTHQRAAKLESAIQAWGVCQTQALAGDPLEGVMSSALGLHDKSTAPAADLPLVDVLRMMPWTRQGSPWRDGSLLYMTPEGGLYKYDPVGSKRPTVTKGIIGPPGTGKSMLMNTASLGMILSPAAVSGDKPNIPFVRIVDVGYSAKGLIDLLKEALPTSLAHQAIYVRFQNSKEFTYNIFGTQPGCRYPLPHERESVINILATKFAPGGQSLYEGIGGLIAAAVDEVFRFRADDQADAQPQTYESGVNREIDDAIERYEIQLRKRANWWDVVDALHACGQTRLATLAQNYAVPTLVDLIKASYEPHVSDIYRHPKSPTGETMQQYFIRSVQEMINDFPVLAGPTAFDLGEARVIVLDMEEVCRSGGRLVTEKTQIMYMVATHILARDFMLREEHATRMPDHFREHNVARIREFSTTTKLLAFGEMHNTMDCPQIASQIELFERLGRKNAFQLVLESQRLADFPPQIAELLTEIYITGVGWNENAEDAAKRFGLSVASAEIIKRRLMGPHQIDEIGTYAAPFLAAWKLDDGSGKVEQMLYNLIGPIETWALSTRPDDVNLRDQLYRTLGHRETWKRLSIVFPHGTAKDEIERRVQVLAVRGKDKNEASRAVISGIASEIENGMGVGIALRSAAEVESEELNQTKHKNKILSWLERAA